MGKKHFPKDTSDKSGELTKETPSSFSRLTPLDVQMTLTRSRKPGIVNGKRRRMPSFSNVETSEEKQDATRPCLVLAGEDHEKVRQTMGSCLESLHNEWFDTKIRDEMRRMRERGQDEMEILENTCLNLGDLKGEKPKELNQN